MEGIFLNEDGIYSMTGSYFEYRNVWLDTDIQGFEKGHRFDVALVDHGIRVITFLNEDEEMIVIFGYHVVS